MPMRLAAFKEDEARESAKLKPSPPAKPPTFLTALKPARRQKDGWLRPPSPFDAVDDTSRSSEPKYMGEDALHHFWELFHHQDARPSPHLSAQERPRSARTAYLAAGRRLNLCPEPLGIVRRRLIDKPTSEAQEVNLRCYGMGDAYGRAFAEGFPFLPRVDVLNVAHNRMGDAVAAQLIAGGAHLQHLNLSHNSLAAASSHALVSLVRRSRTLLSLNLARTGLRDTHIQQLCETLTSNSTVLRLHLSSNRFGQAGMLAIAHLLEENARLEELYLAWNGLRGVGAVRIVEALKFHASLRVCDLSWNALTSTGTLRPRSVVTALADALANNKALLHLDISSNHLDFDDCALLAKHLELNQTLIGLHISGNSAVMDSRGFLIPTVEDVGGSTKLRDQHMVGSIALFEEVHSDTGSGVFPLQLTTVADASCWYCGLWSEHRFTWTPTRSQGPFAGTTDAFEITVSMEVRLHLSIDNWRGIPLERREKDGDGVTFSALRVLPPGSTRYFFTVVDQSLASTKVSYHYVSSRQSLPVSRDDRAVLTSRDVKDQVESITTRPSQVFGSLTRVNVIRLSQRGGRDPCNTLVPRTLGKSSERRGKWDITKSVFARRKREAECRSFVDTDAFIAKACAADWKQCKVERFIKDPVRRREVELSVRSWYRTVYNAYRRYCGHNVLLNITPLALMSTAAAAQLQNDVTCVPWSGYVEFVTETRILDETSEYCSLPDLENVFVAANLELTAEAKEKDNPDRSLTRFEFLESVIRLAMNKYARTNVCETPAKAVDKLLSENVLPLALEDANNFRSRFLYTEEVSDYFTEHLTLLQDLFEANMGKYNRPGEKKGMHLVEFLALLEKYHVFSDSFRVRDVKDPFVACKLVVLDEMTTGEHKKIFLTDFFELVLRVSVLRYPPRILTVADVVHSLHQLLLNHFYKHDALMGQFCDAIDQAVVKDRLEVFASVINSQRIQHQAGTTPTSSSRGGEPLGSI